MKKRILTLILAAACGFSMLTGCVAQEKDTPEETEIYAFVASSLNNAMEEIQILYKKEHPDVVIRYNTDSSGTLQTQIEQGAECDLFFSAATKQMDELNTDGYIIEDSIVNLLENKVVLIKSTETQTAVTGFETIPKAANIALVGEDAPAGQYAREIFTNMGIIDQVNTMEINEAKNVTEVLAAVSEASNEVGVVYATDAVAMKDSVEVIAEAPADSLETPVIYPVGLVKNEQGDEVQKKEAEEFLKFPQTKEALQVFEDYGFTVEIE